MGKLVWALGLLVCITGCDDTAIDPFDNDERYYSIYGFLEVDYEDLEQTVRIIPITRRAERIESPIDPQAEIDAVVTSTNLRTGQTVRWRHSLEKLDDGNYAHIFRSSFFVQQGHTYRLEVERSDGIMTWAETTVPRATEAPQFEAAKQLPETGDIVQEVYLPHIPSPWEITVIYYVGTGITTPFPIEYGRVGSPTDDGGWRFTINVTKDQKTLSSILGVPVDQFQWAAMGMNIRMLDDQWTPPEGLFDPEVLAQPGALSNVENGYGFWGSIGLFQHTWSVSDELAQLLGFQQ